MPGPLCREFRLLGARNGEVFELLHIADNRRRCYHIQVDQVLDQLLLIPLSGWGKGKIDLISFDFSICEEDAQ